MVLPLFTVLELYQYSSKVRRRFAEKLSEIPWESVGKNREASFHSMKNILIHMIDNENWIINCMIRNRGENEDKRKRKSEDYTNMQMILDHLDEVESRTRKYLEGASEAELKRKVMFTISPKKSFVLSVEECVLQSVTEDLYHLGELIALLWQENIEPPKMQWFWNNPRRGLQERFPRTEPSQTTRST
jgi:uncharacterized damage-inducible protein DinB